MTSFNFNDLPEIYQIEATNACQLDCYMCARKLMKREIGYLNPELVAIMVEREDFKNSYLVELQMYGEPLLHPDLDKIIKILKTGTDVKVGFSTNGILLKEKLDTVLMCDYVTISLDADNPQTYEKIRGSSSYEKLLTDLDELLSLKDRPVIDIQLIDLPENQKQIEEVHKIYGGFQRTFIRSVPDCNVNLFKGDNAYPTSHEICLNPWLSVSIFWNGDVVPCCFWFDEYVDDNKKEKFIYGNLFDQSLREIWQNSDRRKELCQAHLFNILPERCTHCLVRSPVLLHYRMTMNWLKMKGGDSE